MGIIRLLGSPQFEEGQGIVSLGFTNPVMMLTYLACKADWVSREEVSALIWPEARSKARLTRLRQILRYAKEQGWCPDLEVDAVRLRWSKGSDVYELRRAFSQDNWPTVNQLYRGPLLAGFSPDEGEPYGSWLLQERQKLRTLWLDAARHHAFDLERQQRIKEALEVWEGIVQGDELAEDALCELLRLCLGCAQYARGFAAYAAFQQRLWREHHLGPQANTNTWLDRLRQAAAAIQASPPITPSQISEDIQPGTLFVGREAEIAQLVAWIDSEAQPSQTASNPKILTVFGPGGVGKTRLVIEAARGSSCLSVFVPLVSLLKGQSVLAAVAQAMGKPLRSHHAEEELREQLQDQRLVLILDNAEHLIEEVGVLASLIGDLAQIKLLITSRLRMGLEDERVMELGGLSLDSGTSAQSAATNLLFHAVRRARPGNIWTPQEAQVASRICHALDGVPLALELAGAWARLFSLSEIEKRLEHKLDFLEGSLETSERHRGLRVVFAHSWQLLSQTEREALCRLSVFEGGFEVGVALEVTGAREQELLLLVDKAMIKIVGETQRRGDIHPLVQGFAREHLTPSQREQTLERHAHYFLRLAQEAEPKLLGPEQIEWMSRLQHDLPNLRLALQWWIGEARAEGGLRLAAALHWFWYVHGHYREGLSWLEQAMAVQGAAQQTEAYAEALRCAGALSSSLGEYGKANELLFKALERFRQLGQARGIARAQHDLGLLLRDQGSPDGSSSHLGAARNHLEQSIALYRDLGETNELAGSLSNLAIVVSQLGQFEHARLLFEESLILKEAAGDLLGMAHGYNNMALILYLLKRPLSEGLPFYHKSLAIKRQLGDLLGAANTLHNLGEDAREMADLVMARTYLSQALTLFCQLNHRLRIAQSLAVFAQLLADEGQTEKATSLASFVLSFARQCGFALHRPQAEKLSALQQQARQTLDTERATLAEASGQGLKLEHAIKLAGLDLSG